MCTYSSSLTSSSFDQTTGDYSFESSDWETFGDQMIVLEIKGTSGSVSAAVTLSLQLSVPSDLVTSAELESSQTEIEALIEEDATLGGLKWSFLSSIINTPEFDL